MRYTKKMTNPPPEWVLKQYVTLQQLQKDVALSWSALPHRVCLVAGCAGSGKSQLLKAIMIACGYGDCLTDTRPKDAPRPKFSALYVVNNNEGVNKFSADLVDMFERLGLGANAPTVLRLYSVDSELATMLKKGKDEPNDPFNNQEATSRMDQFTLADHFLAEYQLLKLTTDSFNAAKIAREQRNKLRTMSLHAHAFKYLEQNRPQYEVLWQLLDMVKGKQELTVIQATQFRERTKVVYEDFLGQFKGIICATPVAASNHSVRSRFTPDLVMIDENARMRELSTLILVAWYSPKAWVILGDPNQPKPHLAIDIERTNPFRESLGTSTLSRAVAGGAVKNQLALNYRQYGDLIALPSKLCYLGEMKSSHNKRYTRPVFQWIGFLQSIHPSQPSHACRLLVEMPGSRTRKTGNSTLNPMHAQWVMQQVEKILNSDLQGEGKNAGNPAKILLMPFYSAQYHQFELGVDQLKMSGKYSAQQISRIRILTLDSSQGDEEDIVLADMSQTDEPGFCGDWQRINLMLTRAVIGQIILMEKGMWLCSDSNPSIASRASVLRSVYLWLAGEGTVLTIPCCDRCESTGDHMTADCPAANRKDGKKDRCTKCETDGHTIETCAKVTTCDNCKIRGHTSNECKVQTRCYRCYSKDHICYECVTNVHCMTCQSTEHATHKGPNKPETAYHKCHNCKQMGHVSSECQNPREEGPDTRKCRHCGERGHVKAACPKVICAKCNQAGHTRTDCTNIICKFCGSLDHESRDCKRRLEYQLRQIRAQGRRLHHGHVKQRARKEEEALVPSPEVYRAA